MASVSRSTGGVDSEAPLLTNHISYSFISSTFVASDLILFDEKIPFLKSKNSIERLYLVLLYKSIDQ